MGWAGIADPILTPGEADGLRAGFFELHGPTGSGWHNSFNSMDRLYRDRAWPALEHVLDTRLRAALPGFEPFSFNYLCKWPGRTATAT